jgi:hypothetical protein
VLESLAAGRDGSWSYEGERWSYYGLYAMEKACIFAGIERIGDVGWYEQGARGLSDQEKDGGSCSYRATQRYPARATCSRRVRLSLPAARIGRLPARRPVD